MMTNRRLGLLSTRIAHGPHPPRPAPRFGPGADPL